MFLLVFGDFLANLAHFSLFYPKNPFVEDCFYEIILFCAYFWQIISDFCLFFVKNALKCYCF